MQIDEKLVTFESELLFLQTSLKCEKDEKINFALAT